MMNICYVIFGNDWIIGNDLDLSVTLWFIGNGHELLVTGEAQLLIYQIIETERRSASYIMFFIIFGNGWIIGNDLDLSVTLSIYR